MAVKKYKVCGSQLREKAAAERDAAIRDVIDRAAKAVDESKTLLQASDQLLRSAKNRRKKRL